MIKEEYVLTRSDGVEIHRHYSDDNRYIIQQETGLKFTIAEDPIPCKYTYVEGDYTEEYFNSLVDTIYTDEKVEDSISSKSTTGSTIPIENVEAMDKVDSDLIS